MTQEEAAAEFAELYPVVQLRLYSRRAKRPAELTPQLTEVLRHLAVSGPVSIGELARQVGRAQSVISEMIDRLREKQLVHRQPDESDRRRKLVWLTDFGRDRIRRDEQLLSPVLLARAVGRMSAKERAALILGMRSLVQAADDVAHERSDGT